MSKIAREVAEAEIDKWLDKKKVFPSTRETYKEYIDTLIDAVMEGVLTLDPETFSFVHVLMFPLTGEQPVEKLTYKSRLNDRTLRPYLNGVKSTDADGRMLAHAAALTGQAREVLATLDSQDKKISTSITVFFV